MFKSMSISDYTYKKAPSVLPDSSIYDAIETILEHRISGITVVNEAGEAVGMLSELDCLRAVLKAAYHQEAFGIVEDYMNTPCETIELNEDIISVAEDMLQTKRRRRPVVEGGKVVGTVTCRQILMAVKEWNKPTDR